ncbi:hypothetical protein SEA_TFORTROY_58 [Arthrobacter phage TforTroy]|uniref:Uncharacterized protein n=1 Tax=Arthrobacter phage TforTroy TaxID=3118973 RepID=A0ABZ2CPY8_9CAUD
MALPIPDADEIGRFQDDEGETFVVTREDHETLKVSVYGSSGVYLNDVLVFARDAHKLAALLIEGTTT